MFFNSFFGPFPPRKKRPCGNLGQVQRSRAGVASVVVVVVVVML